MKQVILVRQDLNLPKGKLAAQVAHASVSCYDKSGFFKKKAWLGSGMKKVVLKVDNLELLRKYERDAKKHKLTTSLIADAGHTVVEAGTITCLGIGPDDEQKIDLVTGELKCL
ncbi:peptidyl-tRNA hydrolase [Candidatus Woesearchaeota archaeon]|nr:peptidyl-tRNA hydrolase [Candidatus Woesearchaeota archaeon]